VGKIHEKESFEVIKEINLGKFNFNKKGAKMLHYLKENNND